MGLDNANNYRRSLLFDIETYPIDGAKDYLEPVSAPDHYKKPETIQNYIAEETAKQLGKCALDPDLCRIVALGIYRSDDDWFVFTGTDEAAEKEALERFWALLGSYPYPRLIGFNVIGFDLPVIIRRSQYLGITTKPIQMGKYRHADVDDLMMILNFDGTIKTHGLKFYAKRFGIPVDDAVSGKDVAALIAAGDWDAVAAHCMSDMKTTAALARRLGVMSEQPEMVL